MPHVENLRGVDMFVPKLVYTIHYTSTVIVSGECIIVFVSDMQQIDFQSQQEYCVKCKPSVNFDLCS